MQALRSAARLAVLVVLGVPVILRGAGQEAPMEFHSITPAGYELMTLQPSGATLSVLALIECPEIEGARQVAAGESAKVISGSGAPLRSFPRRFNFRVTATLRKTVIDDPTHSISIGDDPRQFILRLRFRLKIYNGLEKQEVEPQLVEQVGMPEDIAYDERVYRVNFDVGQRPITDRVVLEVLSPEGERLARFHFELL
ncbi:MAG TPA: hypothetical protein VFL42_11405 [Terriglobales bacterium]|nr:hypothetical protein [Terriglobales bacterium]